MKVKAKDLRGKKKEELLKQLDDLKTVSIVTGLCQIQSNLSVKTTLGVMTEWSFHTGGLYRQVRARVPRLQHSTLGIMYRKQNKYRTVCTVCNTLLHKFGI